MSRYARDRAHEEICRLAREGLDLVSFWRGCAERLAPAVPYYITPCWFTLDPQSLLVTSHFQEGLPEIPSEWLAQEYLEDDFNKMADVARSQRGIATLHQATGGEPARSARYERDMAPYGAEQEMVVGLRGRSGEVWGALGLYREHGQPMFDADDFAFMQTLAPVLAAGARRALVLGEAQDPEGPRGPGLLVLTDEWRIESITPEAEAWLAALPRGRDGALPPAVLAVAGEAMRASGGLDPDRASARLRSLDGRWVALHGTRLEANGTRRVAVIVEEAHPARIATLLMAAYELTEREQDVVRLVLQGYSTAEIASTLTLSTHTVTQHLKSVFEKTGVRSRRDLVGKVFFAHYEPRVRDNERRTERGLAVRGGPMAAAG